MERCRRATTHCELLRWWWAIRSPGSRMAFPCCLRSAFGFRRLELWDGCCIKKPPPSCRVGQEGTLPRVFRPRRRRADALMR
jgi:hypothetical protein|eukprot:SAG25_NODE_393_length_8567_cov_15.363368_5_plen_82_part_00